MSPKKFVRTLPDSSSNIGWGEVEANNICQTRVCFPNEAFILLHALHHESQ